MAIGRRNFIKYSILAGAGIVGASSIGYLSIPKYDSILKKILINDLSGLILKPDAIDRFVADAINENTFGHSFAKKEMMRVYHYIANSRIPLPFKYKYEQYRADIVGKFLLSTDFFYNKMDETKQITYLRIYNPYKFPCGNPFSNLFYPLDKNVEVSG